MSNPELSELLLKADTAQIEGRFEDAAAYYDQAGQHTPGHMKIDQGRRALQFLREQDQTIQQRIADGEALLDERRFAEARQSFNTTLTEAANRKIYRYHAVLEQKLDRVGELVNWERKIVALQKHLATLVPDQSTGPLTDIDVLLGEIPSNDQAFGPFAEQLATLRDQIIAKANAQLLLNRAKEAIDGDDYESAIRHAGSIPDTSPFASSAQLIIKNARDLEQNVAPLLEEIEAAVAEHRLDAALESLWTINQMAPKNPNHRRLWKEIGAASLHQGRELNSESQLDAALQHYQDARTIWEKLNAIDPATDLGALLEEVYERIEITKQRLEAKAWMETHEYNQAEKNYQRTLAQLAAADRGRSYESIRVMVAHDLQSCIEYQQSQAEYNKMLYKAELALQDKHLEEALAGFEILGLAQTKDQQQRRDKGLKEARTSLDQARDLLEKAQAAADPQEGLVNLETAWSLWDSPDIRRLLVASLLEGAHAAISQDRLADGERLANQVLVIEPHNQAARRLVERRSIEEYTHQCLAQIKDMRETLSLKSQVDPGEIDPLIAMLKEALKHVRGHDDQTMRLTDALHDIQAESKRWQTFKSEYDRALQIRNRGNWSEAAKHAEAAKAQLPIGQSTPLMDALSLWAEVSKTLERVPEFAAVLEKARDAYRRYDLVADFLDDLDAYRGDLEHVINTTYAAAERPATPPLPANAQALFHDTDALRAQSARLQEILRIDDPLERLKRLAAVPKSQQDDVLRAYEQALRQEQRAQAPALVRQAEEAQARGDDEGLNEALDLLRQAKVLDPENTSINDRYEQLTRQQALAEELTKYEKVADVNVGSNSLSATVRAYDEALKLLRDPHYAFDERKELDSIISDVDQALSLSGMEDPARWENALGMIRTFVQEASPGLSYQAAKIVEAWAKIRYQIARKGYASSLAQFGELQAAYQQAEKYFKEYPQDADAGELWSNTGRNLFNRTSASVTKRLDDAEKVLEAEAAGVEEAIAKLTSLESEILRPITAEFPKFFELFDSDKTIEASQGRAQELRERAERLQAIIEKLKPILNIVQTDYFNGALEKAQQELYPLLNDESLAADAPKLAAKVAAWDAKIRQALNTRRFAMVQAELAQLKGKLRGAIDVVALKALQTDLYALDITMQSIETASEQAEKLIREIADVAAAISQGIDEITEAEVKVNQARSLISEQNFKRASDLFQEAHRLTRDQRAKAQLRQELDQAQAKATIQDQLRTIPILIAQGEYEAAQAQLLEAARSGVPDLEKLQMTINAGKVLKRVSQEFAVADFDRWDQAERALAHELSHIQALDGREVAELVARIKLLQMDLETQQRLQQEARQHFETIQQHIRLNRVEAVKTALQQVPESIAKLPRYGDLQQQVTLLEYADETRQRAIKLRDEGKRKEAVDLLKQLLNDPQFGMYQPAKSVLYELEEAESAYQAIDNAERYAEQANFIQAYVELDQARPLLSHTKRFGEVSKTIQSLKDNWIDEQQGAIQEYLNNGNYFEALRQCRTSLTETTASTKDIVNKLHELRETISNEWIKSLNTKVASAYGGRDEISDLNQYIPEIQQIAELRAELSKGSQQALEALVYKVYERKFDLEIKQIEKQVPCDVAPMHQRQLAELHTEAGKLKAELTEVETAHSLRVARAHKPLRDLILAIELAIDTIENSRANKDREDRLKQAEARLAKVTTLEDFLQVEQLLMPIKDASPTASDLLAQLGYQKTIFANTSELIARIKEYLEAGNLDRAASTIDDSQSISPHLKTDFDNYQNLIRDLKRARTSSNQRKWLDAIRGYREVEAKSPYLPGLSTYIRRQLRIAAEQALEQILNDCKKCLTEWPPAIERAQQHFTLVELAGLLEFNVAERLTDEYDIVEKRIRQMTLVKAAIEHFAAEPPSIDAIQRLVNEAEAIQSGEFEAPQIQDLRCLIEALEDEAVGNTPGAAQALQRLSKDARRMPPAQQLAQRLESDRSKTELLERQRPVIEGLLDTSPSEAVDAMLKLKQGMKDDARIQPMIDVIVSNLRSRAYQARAKNHLNQAIALTGLARSLNSDDAELESALKTLGDLRIDITTRTFEEIGQALQTDELETAQRLLHDVQPNLVAEQQICFQQFKDRLEQRQPIVLRAKADLDRALQAGKAGDNWSGQITALAAAFQQAPTYQLVTAAIKTFEEALLVYLAHLEQGEMYIEAINVCDQAAPLLLQSGRSRASQLRDALAERHRALMERLMTEARVALDTWDLRAADSAIKRGLKITNKAEIFSAFRTNYAEMEQQVPALKRSMEEGWSQLQNGKLDQAKESFDVATLAAPSFQEAQTWRSYAEKCQQARALVRANDFTQAIGPLENALGLLDPTTSRLPSFLDGARSLRERRVFWRDQAQRMIDQARDLLQIDRKAIECASRGDFIGEEAALERLVGAKQAFGFATAVFWSPSLASPPPYQTAVDGTPAAPTSSAEDEMLTYIESALPVNPAESEATSATSIASDEPPTNPPVNSMPNGDVVASFSGADAPPPDSPSASLPTDAPGADGAATPFPYDGAGTLSWDAEPFTPMSPEEQPATSAPSETQSDNAPELPKEQPATSATDSPTPIANVASSVVAEPASAGHPTDGADDPPITVPWIRDWDSERTLRTYDDE